MSSDDRTEGESRIFSRDIGVKRSVTVTLGAIVSKILGAEMVIRGHSSSTTAERAIRVYLKDKDSAGPGWTYPPFLRARRPVDPVQMQLDIEAELWQELSQEAIDQDVTAQQLLEH